MSTIVELKGGRWPGMRAVETLVFPCSPDGDDIDYGLGLMVFDAVSRDTAELEMVW